MEKAEIEFSDDERGRLLELRFRRRCMRPGFVIKCLAKYQRWRKGQREYNWSGDPEKRPPVPFSGKALSIVEDSAIAMLKKYDMVAKYIMRSVREKGAECTK